MIHKIQEKNHDAYHDERTTWAKKVKTTTKENPNKPRGEALRRIRNRTQKHDETNKTKTIRHVFVHLGKVGVFHVRSREASARQHRVLENGALFVRDTLIYIKRRRDSPTTHRDNKRQKTKHETHA